MKINRSIVDARWIDYEEDGVKFKIQPFPMSMGMWLPNSDEEFIEFTKKRFLYCLIDWQGLVDENDEELQCNEETKAFIFDYVQEISLWITGKLAETADSIVEKKTLVISPSGSTAQADLLVKSVKS